MSLVAPSIDSHRIPEGYAPLFRKLINVVKDIEEGGLIVEEQKRRGREQRLPRDEVTMVVLHQCTFPNRAQIGANNNRLILSYLSPVICGVQSYLL